METETRDTVAFFEGSNAFDDAQPITVNFYDEGTVEHSEFARGWNHQMRYRCHIDSISVPVWLKTPRGGLVRRGSLEPSESGSTYDYVKNDLGLDPSLYSISATVPFDAMSNTLEEQSNG